MAKSNPKKPPFILITQTGREKYPGYENHRCAAMATTMGEFHNIISRALNSAYKHSYTISTAPSSSDAADLLQYSSIISELIHEHHDWEETSYFPALDAAAGKPGLMSSNSVQHREFEEGLQRFGAYCQDPKSAAEWGDGERFREMMEAFATPLGRHLKEEPETFFRLREVDSEILSKVYVEQEKVVLKKANPWRLMPLVLGSGDKDGSIDGLKDPVHVMPWVVPYLTQYVFSWRYGRLWRFNYADYWGNPR